MTTEIVARRDRMVAECRTCINHMTSGPNYTICISASGEVYLHAQWGDAVWVPEDEHNGTANHRSMPVYMRQDTHDYAIADDVLYAYVDDWMCRAGLISVADRDRFDLARRQAELDRLKAEYPEAAADLTLADMLD